MFAGRVEALVIVIVAMWVLDFFVRSFEWVIDRVVNR